MEILTAVTALGYTVTETDSAALDYNIKKAETTLKVRTNQLEVPEGLFYVWADMAASMFLTDKKASGALSEVYDFDAPAKSISEGDTSVTFAIADTGSFEDQFDAIVEICEHPCYVRRQANGVVVLSEQDKADAIYSNDSNTFWPTQQVGYLCDRHTLVEVESVPAEVVAGFYFYHAGEFYTTEANLTALAKARAPELASLVFVKMAETEQLDDATLTEHAEQFSEWAYPVAYAVKAICSYKGKLYRCVQAHSSQADWTPPATARLWKEIGDPTAEYPEWSQPLGAHDAYALGDKVAHSGKHWVSTAANNVWEPGVYGWEEVTE